MRLTILSLTLAMTTGCLIFDHRNKDDREGDDEDVDQPDEDTDVDDSDEDTPERPDEETPDTDIDWSPAEGDLRLYPSGAALGTTLVGSLVAHVDTLPDMALITGLDFYGPSEITILSFQPRGLDELLITLSVAERSPSGVNDLNVQFRDGSDLWVNDAFIVVRDPDDAPQDWWTGAEEEEPVDTAAP